MFPDNIQFTLHQNQIQNKLFVKYIATGQSTQYKVQKNNNKKHVWYIVPAVKTLI